jgi:hypothetical protein
VALTRRAQETLAIETIRALLLLLLQMEKQTKWPIPLMRLQT